MAFWKPSSKCANAARKCARDLLKSLLGPVSKREGSRPKYIVLSHTPVATSDFDVDTCPMCCLPHSPEYDDTTGTIPAPAYLFVPVILRVPISAIPDDCRDGASTCNKIRQVERSSTPATLDSSAIIAMLRVD